MSPIAIIVGALAVILLGPAIVGRLSRYDAKDHDRARLEHARRKERRR